MKFDFRSALFPLFLKDPARCCRSRKNKYFYSQVLLPGRVKMKTTFRRKGLVAGVLEDVGRFLSNLRRVGREKGCLQKTMVLRLWKS